jgi:FimV-like protein
LRFAIDKRSNGAPVIKVTAADQEPFIDVLIELSWPAGPLLREYTFLLDPPEVAAKGLRARRQRSSRVSPGLRGVWQPTATPRMPLRQRPCRARRQGRKGAATHLVEKGETLRKIAGETKYEGVTLEQMLLGLYRMNPSAFVGENINRMRAGAILSIPDQATVAAIPAAEAKQVYVTQAGEWNAYRQKLAAATAQARPGQDEAAQSATGKITAKVEDKPSAVDLAKDQVKVSRTEMAGKGAAGGKPGKAAKRNWSPRIRRQGSRGAGRPAREERHELQLVDLEDPTAGRSSSRRCPHSGPGGRPARAPRLSPRHQRRPRCRPLPGTGRRRAGEGGGAQIRRAAQGAGRASLRCRLPRSSAQSARGQESRAPATPVAAPAAERNARSIARRPPRWSAVGHRLACRISAARRRAVRPSGIGRRPAGRFQPGSESRFA